MENVENQDTQQEEYRGRSLETYKTWFLRAEEALSEARRLAHRDRDWYDNFDDDQWDEGEKKILDRRGQPIVSSNRIKRKVNFLCGIEQKQRSDPSAMARTPQHQDAANVATQVLTYIEDNTRFDKVSSRCFKDMAIEGIEVCEIIFEDGEIVANKIDYDKFFYDPRSCEEDFSDARYLGYQDWFDVEDAKEMFPEAADMIHGTLDSSTYDEGYEDKPTMHWGNSERRRVRIACLYWRDGRDEWHYVYYTGGGILDEGPSRYYDHDGNACCPIMAQSAYVTRENARYGAVRDMISPQSEMNYRRSMALYLLKNRRIWSTPGVFSENEQNPKEEIARADGHLKANGVFGQDWGFIESAQEIQGNFELLQEAKAEIDAQGPNAGLQGRGTESQSGKAIALQQNAGLAEENTLFDSHNDWKLRCYRAFWARAKQFWTEEKAIRTTDNQNAAQFIMVNQPQPVVNEMGQPQIDPMTGQPAMQMQNALAEMDVDIVLELGPDMITLQHEEFEQLTNMVQAGVPIPPDVLLEASQIRDKQELAQRIQQEASAQGQLQAAQKQIEQLQKQLEQMVAQTQQKPPSPLEMAKIEEMQREGMRKDRESQRKDAQTQADIRSKEVNTAKTMKEIMTPIDVS